MPSDYVYSGFKFNSQTSSVLVNMYAGGYGVMFQVSASGIFYNLYLGGWVSPEWKQLAFVS